MDALFVPLGPGPGSRGGRYAVASGNSVAAGLARV